MKSLLLSILFVAVALLGCQSTRACDGHYETIYQTVLVCAGHYESRFVYAPVYYYGRVVSQGRYVQVYYPPQYAVRPVAVWVADPPRVCREPEYREPEHGGYNGENYSEPGYAGYNRRGREFGFVANIQALFQRR